MGLRLSTGSKHTWDVDNAQECRDAQAVYQVWQQQGLKVYDVNGREMTWFNQDAGEMHLKGAPKMSSFKDRQINNLKKMAYRQGARTATNLAHMGLVYVVSSYFKLNPEQTRLLSKTLRSDSGKGLLAWVAGEMLERARGEDSDVLGALSEELQVSGMDLAAEENINRLIELLPDWKKVTVAIRKALEVARSSSSPREILAAWDAVDEAIPQKMRVLVEEPAVVEAFESEALRGVERR